MYEIKRVVSVAWAALDILGEILLCDGMSGKGTGSLLTVPATWILAELRAHMRDALMGRRYLLWRRNARWQYLHASTSRRTHLNPVLDPR